MSQLNRHCYLAAGIYLGSRDRCWNAPQARAIHIRRPGTAIECQHAKPNDLHIEYTECELLGRDLLNRVRAFVTIPGSIYVHCAAGQCRGPTLSLVALICRGIAPSLAVSVILESMWTYYPHPLAPHFQDRVLQEIFEWAESLVVESTSKKP